MPKDALESNALECFVGMLRDGGNNGLGVMDVKVATARCIMALCFWPDAKKLACKDDTIPVLIGLLTDRKAEVRAAAAGALMSITIDCEAKRIMVRETGIPILMDLLNDQNESVLLNTIKTVTNCSEDYRARFQFHTCIKRLEQIKDGKNQQLADAATRAIQ
ncbi:hypothetical protein HK102_003794, partial [Quaeritorhiza haematococci]